MVTDIRKVSTAAKGSLCFIEGSIDVPFEIKRLYYIFDVPSGVERGGHAHQTLSQLLVCVHGAVQVTIDDGMTQETIVLDDPAKGLLLQGLIWRDMIWLQDGSVLMVAASDYYDENEYIRCRDDFVALATKRGGSE